MFIKTIKTLSAAVLASAALSVQAATVQLAGTIDTCNGLCAVLSATGNSVDITYDDTFTAPPTLTIEGQGGGVLTFINEMYAPNISMMPLGALSIPTPALTHGVDLSSNADQVSVFGLGSTTGAPVWGIFDLVNNTFESYLFTPDSDGAGTPAVLFLSDGTFTAVPVPAAAWFMLSGLVGLFGAKRVQAKK